MAKGDPFILDTSAFIALTDEEAGHERVAELIRKAARNDVKLHACFVSLTEVQYNAEYDHGEAKAREIIAHLVIDAPTVVEVGENDVTAGTTAETCAASG